MTSWFFTNPFATKEPANGHCLCITLLSNYAVVATSPLAFCWICDSPRTGCVRRITPINMWREQAIIEWSWRVISGDTNDVNVTIAYAKSDHGMWSLLLLAATRWSFAHFPLGLSDRNTIASAFAYILCRDVLLKMRCGNAFPTPNMKTDSSTRISTPDLPVSL